MPSKVPVDSDEVVKHLSNLDCIVVVVANTASLLEE